MSVSEQQSFDDDYPDIRERRDAGEEEKSERMKRTGVEPGPNKAGEPGHYSVCDSL